MEEGEINSACGNGLDLSYNSCASTSLKINDSNTPLSTSEPSTPKSLLNKFKVSYKRTFSGCSSLEDYRIIEKCGEGTFGEVYKAKNRRTGALVALKKMLMDKESDGFPITALREIKYLKFAQHPNLIGVVDIAYAKDQLASGIDAFYLVLPFMEHDLYGLFGNPKVSPFSFALSKYYMRSILEGVAFLHSKKIMHRDLKAANILLNNQGDVKIADFGLAQQYMEFRLDYTPMVVTRWYRPPELLLGCRKYTSAIDIWGVGCIFGEFISRTPILAGSSDINQLELICQLCGTPSEAVWPGVSLLPDFGKIKLPECERKVFGSFSSFGKDFEDLIDRMLVLDPKQRISAEEALRHPFFSQEPIPEKSALTFDALPSSHSLKFAPKPMSANGRVVRPTVNESQKSSAYSSFAYTPLDRSDKKRSYDNGSDRIRPRLDYKHRRDGDRQEHNHTHPNYNERRRRHQYYDRDEDSDRFKGTNSRNLNLSYGEPDPEYRSGSNRDRDAAPSRHGSGHDFRKPRL